MLGSCLVNIPTSIHITVIIITGHIYVATIMVTSSSSKKLLSHQSCWFILCPQYLPATEKGTEVRLLAPSALCKRAIRWGPAIITQVSKWLWLWTLKPGEKV